MLVWSVLLPCRICYFVGKKRVLLGRLDKGWFSARRKFVLDRLTLWVYNGIVVDGCGYQPQQSKRFPLSVSECFGRLSLETDAI